MGKSKTLPNVAYTHNKLQFNSTSLAKRNQVYEKLSKKNLKPKSHLSLKAAKAFPVSWFYNYFMLGIVWSQENDRFNVLPFIYCLKCKMMQNVLCRCARVSVSVSLDCVWFVIENVFRVRLEKWRILLRFFMCHSVDESMDGYHRLVAIHGCV